MVVEFALDVVSNFERLVHKFHSILEFVGRIGEQFPLAYKLRFGILPLLHSGIHTSSSAPISIYLLFSSA
jgi:hypothetical protein